MPEIRVRDIMAGRVVSCPPGTSVAEAARRMRDEDVGSIVVVEGGRPVGIVTREDITNRVAAQNLKPAELTVRQIMTSPVITASPDDDIVDVAAQMARLGYERFPVRALGRLVGFISVRDILRVSPGLLELFRERLEREPPVAFEETVTGDCELCGNFSEFLRKVNERWVCDTCRDEAAEL